MESLEDCSVASTSSGPDIPVEPSTFATTDDRVLISCSVDRWLPTPETDNDTNAFTIDSHPDVY
jgi:hypothetical protein